MRGPLASVALVALVASLPAAAFSCRGRDDGVGRDPSANSVASHADPTLTQPTPSSPPAPSPSTPPRKLSAAECHSVWSTMQAALLAVVTAHSKCATAADCQLVGGDHCRWASCGGLAVEKSAVPLYEAAQRDVLARECVTWESGDCMKTTPIAIPTCPPYHADCIGGACSAVMF